MKDTFALLPESGHQDVSVERQYGSVVLLVGGEWTIMTPSEARQVAAALARLAALRPVPAA